MGVETEGGSQLLRLRKGRGHEKWAVKRGRVMQMYARVSPTQEKGSSLFGKKKKLGRNRKVE